MMRSNDQLREPRCCHRRHRPRRRDRRHRRRRLGFFAAGRGHCGHAGFGKCGHGVTGLGNGGGVGEAAALAEGSTHGLVRQPREKGLAGYPQVRPLTDAGLAAGPAAGLALCKLLELAQQLVRPGVATV